MNRYSLVFALLVASSFAVHSPQAGNTGSAGGKSESTGAAKTKVGAKPGAGENEGTHKLARSNGQPDALTEKAVPFIKVFLDKQADGAKQALQILFATVPHPTETHLASSFDDDVSALQDGLQESGYLFDSAWIPWSDQRTFESFDDDDQEKTEGEREDNTPGILLFRKNHPPDDPYANGVLVFLIAEKPTEGINVAQAETALNILKDQALGDKMVQFSKSKCIKILGPNFSGSFDSLVPTVALLHKANPGAKIVIRSGSATGGKAASEAMEKLAGLKPKPEIDFGSAQHDNWDWTQLALDTLEGIGIDKGSIATLSEDESAYGAAINSSATNPPATNPPATNGQNSQDAHYWRLFFPRDISNLRVGYQNQGILETPSTQQPWRRFLNLKTDEQGGGDSIQSFGGSATLAKQESILFGLSEFLKSHGIRAVIIYATNEEDDYFLSQFFHAHNAGVRVVLIGVSRVFMRGSTAQFRGDMAVDDFPMLPRLHDWTSIEGDRFEHIFPNNPAQGAYFAAIDLFAEPNCRKPNIDGSCPASQQFYKWQPEYSEPNWDNASPPLQPPMYVVALGDKATWPVAESSFVGFSPVGASVEMPFTLFKQYLPVKSEGSPLAVRIHVARIWIDLFMVVCGLTVLYGACFWFANPISRVAFASFAPSPAWRFWVFKVALPATVSGCAFRVLAWSIEMPAMASSDAVSWGSLAQKMTVVAPLGIALAAAIRAVCRLRISRICERGPALHRTGMFRVWIAVGKGILISILRRVRVRAEFRWYGPIPIAFIPALVAVAGLFISKHFEPSPAADHEISFILNSYREMHWDSGLSLVPTALLFLMGFLVWASQASDGAATFGAAPLLPKFPRNERISRESAKAIRALGMPLPFGREGVRLWILWGTIACLIAVAHYRFAPFQNITTLETPAVTGIVRVAAGMLAALILLDVLQFVWLWKALQSMLRALNRMEFRRSFVPIRDFNWRSLWSFTGLSFQGRRAIIAALIDCVLDLANNLGFAGLRHSAEWLKDRRDHYNSVDLSAVSLKSFTRDTRLFFEKLVEAGDAMAWIVANPPYMQAPDRFQSISGTLQAALAGQGGEKGGQYKDEAAELTQLEDWQRAAEKFLCLMYINFIQTVVARLHTLLVSVALMFSLTALGVAIYPFVPLTPYLVTGLMLIGVMAWSFFKIFSEMDTDPILSRIVNGDDRRLQGNFYLKFAEAIALPLLTLSSSFLPGGAGRLLELAQTLFNHGQ